MNNHSSTPGEQSSVQNADSQGGSGERLWHAGHRLLELSALAPSHCQLPGQDNRRAIGEYVSALDIGIPGVWIIQPCPESIHTHHPPASLFWVIVDNLLPTVSVLSP